MIPGRSVAIAFAAGVLVLGAGCASHTPAGSGQQPTSSATTASPGNAPSQTSVPPSPSITSAAPRTSRPPSRSPSTPPSTSGVSPALVTTTAHAGRYVALTFDDGPNPTYTPQILALLRQYGIHATFCEIGDAAQIYPGLVHDVIADGNRLCDHTMTHDEQLGTRSAARIASEIATDQQLLRTLGGGAPIRYYRQPGGNWTWQIQVIAARDGMQNLSWSVDPRDWSMPGTNTIIARVEANLRPGSVLLMHDGDGDVAPGGGDRSESVAALRVLLPWMIAQGYRFDFPA